MNLLFYASPKFVVLRYNGPRKPTYPSTISFLLYLLAQSRSKGQALFCPLYLTFSCCLVSGVTRVSTLLRRFIPTRAQGAAPCKRLPLVCSDLLPDHPLMKGAPADEPLSYIKKEILKTSL